MEERKLYVECLQYNRVLPSGNMYTKQFAEKVVKQFKEDEKFRESISLIPSIYDSLYISYPDVALKLTDLWMDDEEQCLFTNVLLLDTPAGRLLEQELNEGRTLQVLPKSLSEPVKVDGIDIITKEAELYFFEYKTIPYAYSSWRRD
jgi:hypothetical protein